MYNLRYWYDYYENPQFVPLDTLDSDTVSVAEDSGGSAIIQDPFYSVRLPMGISGCDSFCITVSASFVSGDEPTGLLIWVFPQNEGEVDQFSFAPLTYWGQYHSYQECPIGEPVDHVVPPLGTWTYNAALLAEDWPNVTDLVIGLRSYPNEAHRVIGVTFGWYGQLASVGDTPLPASWTIGVCYPNPFNGATAIPLNLERLSSVTVVAYNLLGQQVSTIFNGDLLPGNHTLSWQPHDVGTGTYVVRVFAGSSVADFKATYIK